MSYIVKKASEVDSVCTGSKTGFRRAHSSRKWPGVEFYAKGQF